MRELVRAPYMAIRAVWTRTALPTADSHKFTQDLRFPRVTFSPLAYRHHKLFSHTSFHTSRPRDALGIELSHVSYTHACMHRRIVCARIHVHVSRPPVERKQIERIRKRGRLLRHRIRKRSSFRAWWWENAIRIWPAIRTGTCFRAIRLFSLDWIFVDFWSMRKWIDSW